MLFRSEELAKALSLFAPYTAEDMWHLLGHEPSVANAKLRSVDESLLVRETLTAVAQVDGKLRDKFEVSTTITEDELRELVMNSDAVKRALEGKEAKNIIVRAPKLVNISTK